MMNPLRKHIPNFLSLCNAFFGGLAIYMLTLDAVDYAIWCMMGSLVCDFLDGFMARRLNSFSPLGKDLDSLSDAVSFAVFPSTLLSKALAAVGFFMPALSYLIVMASVYRLAKFNHDDRQSKSFLGLPTPANALFLVGFSVFLLQNSELLIGLPRMIEYKVQAGYLALILLLSYLLVSDIPMFGLKTLKAGHLNTLFLAIVIGLTAIGLLFFGWMGFALGFGAYILLNTGHYLAQLAIK